MSLLIQKTVLPPAYKEPYSLESGKLIDQYKRWKKYISCIEAEYSSIPKIKYELDEIDFHPAANEMNRLLESLKK
ncbi:hypothetical protein D3C80_1933480 [compost metagenome]|jgi:hypothetical protein